MSLILRITLLRAEKFQDPPVRFCVSQFAVLFAGSAQAATDRLISLSADDRTSGSLSLVLDAEGQIAGLQIRGLDEEGESAAPPRTLSYGQLAAGTPLFQASGHTVMTVELGSGFNPIQGGRLTFRYFTNVVTGSHRDVELELAKDLSGNWSLIRQGVALSSALIETGTFGVANIAWATTRGAIDGLDIQNEMNEMLRPGKGSVLSESAFASVTERQQKSGPAAGGSAPAESAPQGGVAQAAI